MNIDERLRRLALLLADWRQCFPRGEFDLQESSFAIFTANSRPGGGRTKGPRQVERTRDGPHSSARPPTLVQPADWPERAQETAPEILRQGKEFVDIAFAIANVHTALGRAQKRDGLTQILEPAITFLVSIGTRVWFTSRLSAAVALNLLRVQNFTADRPSRVPLVVTTRLECVNTPHKVWVVGCPAL
ncbi:MULTISPECIES: hypothetical protein [Bradyrhizobium]|uniref:hypothetical protein n=1 Tax=Bradyrhizobium TaxID=374 RepID=UPI00131A088D|nr:MULTISPECIES: hypothetical protein [Bradyrhizobium]UWU93705.1 hypothetical protein N2604_07530 [Bradyrhizobium sp. CB1015]